MMDKSELRIEILDYLRSFVVMKTLIGEPLDLTVTYCNESSPFKRSIILKDDEIEEFLKSENAERCHRVQYSIMTIDERGSLDYRYLLLTSYNENNKADIKWHLRKDKDMKMIGKLKINVKQNKEEKIESDNYKSFKAHNLSLTKARDVCKEYLD